METLLFASIMSLFFTGGVWVYYRKILTSFDELMLWIASCFSVMMIAVVIISYFMRIYLKE